MQEFRDAIERRDLDAAVALCADEIVAALLGAVSQVFEDFHYTRQIGAAAAADHALVFCARVGDREVEGCDFIHLNEDGLMEAMGRLLKLT